MYRYLLIFILCSASAAGCAVHELGCDQDKIRTALLDLYTNQLIDNLIRAYNKMPIIQMDYSNATATVTMKESCGATENVPTTHSNVLTVAAASTFATTRTVLNTVTGTGLIDHTNQIAVIGTPVTATDAVYDAYEKFLEGGGLKASCDPPRPGAAHLCKRCGELYYWVPMEYQKEFLRLALATTAQRAQPLAPLDAFYSVNILQILSFKRDEEPKSAIGPLNPLTPPAPEKSKQSYKIIVKIDKKIPIDDGYMEVSSGGKIAGGNAASGGKSSAGDKGAPSAGSDSGQSADKTGIFLIAQLESQPPEGRTRTTNELRILFDESDPPANFKTFSAFQQSLQSQSLAAKVYLRRHRPQSLPPGDANSHIEFYLQQIQQAQIRNGGL